MILAGVVIATLTGNKGILNKSKLARNTYQNSASNENSILSDYENEIDKATFDVLSSRDNNSNDITDFSIEVSETNATYITVKVKNIESNANIIGYIAVINGKAIDFTKEQEYSFTNLNKNTDYNVELVAVDENVKIKYSNKLREKTSSRLYLYNRGNECIPVTGGWKLNNIQPNGRYKKNSDNILLYYSHFGGSESELKTISSIKLRDFSKLYVVYNKTQIDASTNYTFISCCGIESKNTKVGEYIEEFDLPNFNNNVTIYNYDSYDEIYEVYAE